MKELKDKSVNDLLAEWRKLSEAEKQKKATELKFKLKPDEKPTFEHYLNAATSKEGNLTTALCQMFYGRDNKKVETDIKISFSGIYNSYGLFGKSPNTSPSPAAITTTSLAAAAPPETTTRPSTPPRQ